MHEERREKVNAAMNADMPIIQEAAQLVIERTEGIGGLDWYVTADGGEDDDGTFRNDYYLYLFPATGEVVGGKDDGTQIFDFFFLHDVLGLYNSLGDELGGRDISFNSGERLPEDDLIPSLIVSGTFRNRSFVFYILSRPPQDSEPVFNTNDQGHFWARDLPGEEED